MTTTYDAIVIGTGQAGPSLAVRLAGAGMKVAIISARASATPASNTGCIPTKTLIASARAAHIARRAAEYGVGIGGSIAVDMKRVQLRSDLETCPDKYHDIGTSDFLTGLMEQHEKMAWMLRAFLEDESV